MPKLLNPQYGTVMTEGNRPLWHYGTTVPTDGAANWEKGCVFFKTDEADGTCPMYVNIGSKTSCNFDRVTVS